MPPRKTADQVRKELNAFMKEDVIQFASDPKYIVTYMSTGVFPIDAILQGGLPRGRFTEIYGDYSTFKSYIGYRAIATTQEAGGIAALVDTEHAFDPVWAESLGVNVKDLLIKRPPSGEDAVDVSEILIRQGIDLIVWDSVAATLPQDVSKKRMGKENVQPGRLAFLMSEASRRLTTANERTAVLFINQTRLNIGVTFGDPMVVSGGRALGYYASYRIGLKKSGRVTEPIKKYAPADTSEGVKEVDGKRVIGMKITAKVEKSKLSKPFDESVLLYDLRTAAIDETGFIIARALENGWIKKKGNMYQVGSRKAVNGVKALRGLLESNPTVVAELKERILPTGSPAPRKKLVVRKKLVRRSA